MLSRLATPGPMVSKSTPGLESVVAFMNFLRMTSEASRSPIACPEPVADLLIFFVRIVQAHDAGSDRRQLRCGHHERIAVQRVESLRDVASQFEVLRLIVADRHDAGLVQQNVGGHQHRVLQQVRRRWSPALPTSP